MVDLTELPPAQPARERARGPWGRILALLGVAMVAYATVPFVSYFFVGGALGGDGSYALMLVPVVVAAALGGLLMWRQGMAGMVLGVAGPAVAIVTCGAYFLATSREPVVAVGWIAVAVGPLAAGIAALGLPGRWRLAGLVVLVLTVGSGTALHHAGETDREDAALAGLARPYVLADPDLVMYDAQVGETYSTVSYAGPGYSYSVITAGPGDSSSPGGSECRPDAPVTDDVLGETSCLAAGVPDGWRVVVTGMTAPEAEVADLAAHVVPMSDDDLRRWAG